MGDAVLDQHVREYIVLKLQSKPNRLHQVSKIRVHAGLIQHLPYKLTLMGSIALHPY
jgi:23S rRNA maturation mini-RNase III